MSTKSKSAHAIRSKFDSVDDWIEDEEIANHPQDPSSSSSNHPHFNPFYSSSSSSSSRSSPIKKRTSKDHDYSPISATQKAINVKKQCSNLTASSSSQSKLNCIIAKHSDDPNWDPSILNPASARRSKSLSQLGLIYPSKGAAASSSSSSSSNGPTSFHSSVGKKGASHLGLGLIQPSRSSLEKQRSNLSGLESPLPQSERIGDLGETSDRGRRWYDAQLGQGKPRNSYISNENDNSGLPYSSAYPSSQKGLHLDKDYKHPLSNLNPLKDPKSKFGYSKSILDDDALLSVPSWNRRPRNEASFLRQRARDLTGRWTWRWSPGNGWIAGRSKDWGVYATNGGVGNAMAALLPPSQPAGLS